MSERPEEEKEERREEEEKMNGRRVRGWESLTLLNMRDYSMIYEHECVDV